MTNDQIFNVLLSLISAFFGSALAYWAFSKQKIHEIEINKMEQANRVILKSQKALDNLVAIKNNYCKEFPKHPLQRLLSINYIIFNKEFISDDVSGIIFLATNNYDNKSWKNILRINKLFANYNDLLTYLEKRNELILELQAYPVFQSFSKSGHLDISTMSIYKSINGTVLFKLIDLNERVLMLIDVMIGFFDNFMKEFPEVVKSEVNKKNIEKYQQGAILTVHYFGEYYNNAIKPVTPPDFEEVKHLYSGLSVTQIQERYKPPII